MNARPDPLGCEQFAAIIKRDIEVWRNVVQRAGVKAE